MASVNDIRWGKYREYEGPFYPGKCKFVFQPQNIISEDDARVAVISATEGGCYDAINMYDRCIISVGLVQWCEASMFGVSNMLGTLAGGGSNVVGAVNDYCTKENLDVEFKNCNGKWRFVRSNGSVTSTLKEQQKLFLLDSTGVQGSWNEESKEYAKKWAALFASLFEDKNNQQLQNRYTAKRLMGFVTKEAAPIMFDNEESTSPWKRAAQAGFLSFAANLPAVASKHLLRFVSGATTPKWSESWVKGLFKELTFGPGITIYPQRYNVIRPVLERLYGVDLPDFAIELSEWRDTEGIIASDEEHIRLDTTMAIQTVLSELGYDLGPCGADGVMGPKTVQAIMDFQSRNSLRIDGIVGPRTRAALLARLYGR